MKGPNVDITAPARETPTAPPTSSPPPSSSGAPTSGSSSFIMGAINSAIALVKNPVSYMTSDKDVSATVNSIMINYVAVLAAIPFIATLIGDLWYYSLFGSFAGYLIGYAFLSAVLTYIFDLISVYVVAIVIQMLSTNFGSTNDKIKSLKLSAWVFTPAFLISVLNIIPFLGVLTILGLLYGLYILYLGVPLVLNTPKDKVLPYVVVIVVATFVVFLVVSAIIGAVTAAVFISTFRFL